MHIGNGHAIWCFQNFKVCSFELFGDLFNCAIPRLNFMRWCKIKWAYIKLWERNLVSHYMFFILNGHVMNQNKKEVDKVIAHRWENVVRYNLFFGIIGHFALIYIFFFLWAIYMYGIYLYRQIGCMLDENSHNNITVWWWLYVDYWLYKGNYKDS